MSVGYIAFSLSSNILVMLLFDLCSPVTYLVSAQLKGIILSGADIFYLDYAIAVAINFMWTFVFSNNLIDIENVRNNRMIDRNIVFAFGMKSYVSSVVLHQTSRLVSALYISEKVLIKRKERSPLKSGSRDIELGT